MAGTQEVALTVIVIVALAAAACTAKTTEYTDTPSFGRFEAIVQEVLDYGPPVRGVAADPQGDTLHITVTVEYGTGEEVADAVLDHAFGMLEVAEEADAYHLGINVQYPDRQTIVGMIADRTGMFEKP